tara:strand:+ start:245 stop:2605 length:2361 start_codon:yes stop_codon:yes gene_type:complete
MPVEKATNSEDLPMGQTLDIEIDEEDISDVDIEIDLDGGVTVNLGEEDDEEVPYDANLAEVLPEDVLSEIGSTLSVLFDADKSSRAAWEEQYSGGMELLGFSMEDRSKPFKGACGVYHPLLSESVVQFQSQALKELMPAGGPVRTQVLGKETREKLMQADRVRDFMNYQITTAMPEYTPDFDQLLFYVGYGGSAFKKIYYDEAAGRMVSTLVLPDDLYIPYHGSSVMSKCERVTHRVFMSENAYRKAVVAGKYLDAAEVSEESAASSIQEKVDKITGMSASGDQSEVILLEFQIDYDLPGFEDMDEDGEPTGIKLPYIITMDEASGNVVGVRRNWKEDDEKRERCEYYIHYLLVQGPGSYGLGFLHLVGGLSKTASAALRQLTDAGTLANLPAGFKAKGARIMNDDVPLQPGEWRDMDAGGMELSGSLLPLPYKEPSQTLFQLLGFCVDAGRRMASITDMQVGDSNQNAAVGTTIALLEKGSAVMSAIHKRLHYSQKLEFQLLAKGFCDYLPEEYPYDVPGESRSIKSKDFDDRVDILPVSDPNIFSVAQRITMAQTQLQLAQSAPQMHNMYEAYRRMYEAIGVRDIDTILNTQDIDKPKDPAGENSQALDGSPLKAYAGQQHDAHIQTHILFALSPMVAQMPNVGTVLLKHILEHVQLKAQETVEAELFTQYGTDPDSMVSALQREAMVAIKVAQFYQEVKDLQSQLSGEDQQQPDPVVELKKQELAQSAERDKGKAELDKAKLVLDQQQEQNDVSYDQARISTQQQLANERNQITLMQMQQRGR